MAKKVSKKTRPSASRAAPAPAATRAKAAPAGAAGFSEGLDTSDLPDNSLPEVTIKDGNAAVIRFLPYHWAPGDKTVLSMRGLVHQMNLGDRFRKFTCMGEGCPLCAKGDSPRHEFFTLVLVRAVRTEQKYTQGLVGRVCLLRLGKRAVEMLDKEVVAVLGKRKLEDVDIQWKRHGKTTDTVHLFQLAPKTAMFTAAEKKAIAEAKSLSVWDKVKPLSPAVLQTKATMLGGGAAEVPEGVPDPDPSNGADGLDLAF